MATIETTSFDLADGVSDDAFLTMDGRFETEFVYQQPGLIRRTMTKAGGQRWQSFVVWYDSASAEASLANEHVASVASEHRLMIKVDSVERHRFDTVG
jgi:hypothetical protein